MVARKAGSVVVIGSRAVSRPWEGAGASAYTAAKAAVVALARVSAQECLKDRVRVNAILPNTIDTPANRAAMPDSAHDEWVPTEAIAHLARFLLSDEAEQISGAAIPVYGRA